VDGALHLDQLQYITLSYRWGPETGRTSLKTENKQVFYQSIPTHAWPQVYRDAVSVAQRLGVRYLWIDSLCIIQNEKQDWKTQAALMDKIYSCGRLNFAAVAGAASQGLEVTRHPLGISPCEFTKQQPGSEPGESGIKRWLCHRAEGAFGSAVDPSPLYKRGWTFQERVLSRRIVHFGDELFWECSGLHASETLPLGNNASGSRYSDQAMMKTTLQGQSMSDNEASTYQSSNRPSHPGYLGYHGVHHLWGNVVRCYSRTDLTVPSDKLTALNGIASSAARRFGLSMTEQHYLAGLWRHRLPQQMLWHGDQRRLPDTAGELALRLARHFPSWSWASFPGATRLYGTPSIGPLRSFIRLDDARASDDNETAADPACLVLSGRLLRCEDMGRHGRELTSRNWADLDWFKSKIRIHHGVDSTELSVQVKLDGPILNRASEAHLLPVLQTHDRVMGLMLRSDESAGMDRRVFRRLAMFECQARTLVGFIPVVLRDDDAPESETYLDDGLWGDGSWDMPGGGLAPEVETLLKSQPRFMLL
jgi:hypothetical protein